MFCAQAALAPRGLATGVSPAGQVVCAPTENDSEIGIKIKTQQRIETVILKDKLK